MAPMVSLVHHSGVGLGHSSRSVLDRIHQPSSHLIPVAPGIWSGLAWIFTMFIDLRISSSPPSRSPWLYRCCFPLFNLCDQEAIHSNLNSPQIPSFVVLSNTIFLTKLENWKSSSLDCLSQHLLKLQVCFLWTELCLYLLLAFPVSSLLYISEFLTMSRINQMMANALSTNAASKNSILRRKKDSLDKLTAKLSFPF